MNALLKGNETVKSQKDLAGRIGRAEADLPGRTYLAEPSPWEADGLHFTVEWKSLAPQPATWERVEQSWELPEPLTSQQQAEAVARALALHSNGARAYRVVDPHGKARQVFAVTRCLAVWWPEQEREQRVMLPADFEAPALSDVLARFAAAHEARTVSTDDVLVGEKENRHRNTYA